MDKQYHRVWNIAHENDGCKVCGSWEQHWINNTGQTIERDCPDWECNNKSDSISTVVEYHIEDIVRIIPLCSSCKSHPVGKKIMIYIDSDIFITDEVTEKCKGN